MSAYLNNFVGSFGVTTDGDFGVITDLLAAYGVVIKEDETAPNTNSWTELVTTTYAVGEERYELWYQVRTPFSPEDMNCSFGFDKLEVAVI